MECDNSTFLIDKKAKVIDDSIKVPALLFVLSSAGWLVAGTILLLIGSIRLTNPGFLSGCEYFTYGKITDAQQSMWAYGWACNVVFGVCLWVIARLSGRKIASSSILLVAGLFWNLAVTIGVVGIFKGEYTGLSWIAFHPAVNTLLLIAYAMIGVWGIVSFMTRTNRNVFAAQWFILAALLVFPWIFSTASIALSDKMTLGILETVIHSWFVHNYFALFLTPAAVGVAYYLVPKFTGKAISGYSLAPIAFWALIIIAPWGGGEFLLGGPVPMWLQAAGQVSVLLMVIPVGIIVYNIFGSLFCRKKGVCACAIHPFSKFIVFGMLGLIAYTALKGALVFPEINAKLHFTFTTLASEYLGFYAFFSMIMFGGVYFMLPRLLGKDWCSKESILMQFVFSFTGIIMLVFFMLKSGCIQSQYVGQEGNVMQALQGPLRGQILAISLLLISHIMFLGHCLCLIASALCPCKALCHDESKESATVNA